MKRLVIAGLMGIFAVATIATDDTPPISTPITPTDDRPAAIAVAAKQGEANARRDIEAGRLRIVYPSETAFIFGPQGHFDPETGYPRYPIAACTAGRAFDAEVEAYNRSMREWHAKQKKP